MKAILVVGHGSRSKDAQTDFETVIGFMQEKMGEEKVAGAHMELAKPSIEEVIEELWNEGYKELTIVPYFLYNGNHIKKDIPEIIEEQKKKYDGLVVEMVKPIGADPLMADLLIKRAKNQ